MPADDGWRCLLVGHDEVQVYPVNDVIAHDLNEDRCVCGPTLECIPRAGRRDAWSHVHHSLDGRELDEASTRRPNA